MNASTVSVTYVAIGVVILVAIALAILAATRAARSRRLARRFGPEYEREVQQRGERAEAERELAGREERVRRFHIEELPAGARERYVEEWRTVQNRFIDEPHDAVRGADRLVESVMRDRGYPLEAFDQRAADISPDHPRVVQDFRIAHHIAENSEATDTSTEELRRAMMHYRTVFDDLVRKTGKGNTP